jgi:hypothetical protein
MSLKDKEMFEIWGNAGKKKKVERMLVLRVQGS